MTVKIATDIETKLFFAIPNFLKEQGWQLTAEYKTNLLRHLQYNFKHRIKYSKTKENKSFM